MDRIYSDSFIAKVKQVYPSSILMHELAEDSSYLLGELLKKYAEVEISPERIMSDTHENLKAMAKSLKERRKLYEDWLRLTEKERPKI